MNNSERRKKTGERKKRFANIRLSVVIGTTFFPIDLAELAQMLKDKDYQITAELPLPGIGRRIGGSGVIGRTGTVSVVADSDRRVVGVEGRCLQEVLLSFEQLMQILKDKLWVDTGARAVFFEAIVRFSVLSGKKPLEAVAKFFTGLKSVEDLESVVGEPLSLFTIRLVPRDGLPHQEEWFDIRIEPEAALADTAYSIEIIYRKALYDRVRDFLNTIEGKTDAILDILER